MEQPPEAIGQCEMRCPVSAALAFAERRATENSNLLGAAALHLRFGLQRAEAMWRATQVCEFQKLDEAAWLPSETCVKRAQQIVETLHPMRSELTDHERNLFFTADIQIEEEP